MSNQKSNSEIPIIKAKESVIEAPFKWDEVQGATIILKANNKHYEIIPKSKDISAEDYEAAKISAAMLSLHNSDTLTVNSTSLQEIQANKKAADNAG